MSIDEWITGKDLAREKKCTPLGLFTLVVRTGLQPHDKRGKAIPPPDVKKCQEQIDKVEKKRKELSAPTLMFGPTKMEGEDKNTKIVEYGLMVGNTVSDIDLAKKREEKELENYRKELNRLKSVIDELFAYLESCKNRGGVGEINSWHKFDFNKCPVALCFSDKARDEAMDLLIGESTLYLRKAVDQVIGQAILKSAPKAKEFPYEVAAAIYYEIEPVYESIKKNVGFGRDVIGASKTYLTEATKALGGLEVSPRYLTREHLEDTAIYLFNQPKRDIFGKLIQKILSEKGYGQWDYQDAYKKTREWMKKRLKND